jgi:hypothetical protein
MVAEIAYVRASSRKEGAIWLISRGNEQRECSTMFTLFLHYAVHC